MELGFRFLFLLHSIFVTPLRNTLTTGSMGRFFLPVFKLKPNMSNIAESDFALIHIAVFAMLMLGLLSDCGHAYAQNSASAESNPSIEMSKNQTRTSRTIVEEHGSHLRAVMTALYRLNPDELQKSASVSPEEMIQWVFEGPFGWKFDALRNAQGIEALNLAFDPEFHGDRILAMITGIQTMIITAYGGKTEFLFPDPINPHHLNIAALNMDKVLWKLKNTSNAMRIEHAQTGNSMEGNILSNLTKIKQGLELDARMHAEHSSQNLTLDQTTIETVEFLPF